MADFLNIVGMPVLRQKTKGDPKIKIAIIDGGIDLLHPCFEGANLKENIGYWMSKKELEPKQKKFGKDHGTFITSLLFGQPETSIEGISPECCGEFFSFCLNTENPLLDLARAIDAAHDSGANIIHVSVATPTLSGKTDELLTKAIQRCLDDNIIIVAPAGNDKGECRCIPAAVPGVLVVGAINDEGVPFRFSNWGGIYQKQGIVAPGENIKGAELDGGIMEEKGTSCSAPIVTGIAALLMSLQKQQGIELNGTIVRNAIIDSVDIITSAEISGEERDRYLAGKLNIPAAMRQILNTVRPIKSEKVKETSVAPSSSLSVQTSVHDTHLKSNSIFASQQKISELKSEISKFKTSASTINKNVSSSNIDTINDTSLVFVLGTLGYDFGSEVRCDAFRQFMPEVVHDGVSFPANPHDSQQLIQYLENNLSETQSLIITLNVELTPIYAIEANGPFAREVYETLVSLLNEQIKPEDDKDYIERVSMPGIQKGKTITLFSGQTVPVIEVGNNRGIYGWKVKYLIDDAVSRLCDKHNEGQVRASLTSFLDKIYYELRNLGTTSPHRALNFAATNAFQATTVFSDSLKMGMELDDIQVDKSPFGRINSDCWDILIKFFNPNDNRQSKRVYRFTIDVSDIMPVSLGNIRSWSVS